MNQRGKKVKSKHWSDNETKVLLELCKEKKIVDRMDGKETRFADLYKELSAELEKRNFNRSAEQVKTRMKTLKDKYTSINKELKKSGSGGAIEWEFFNVMHELYGPRPSQNRQGIDSSEITLRTDNSKKTDSSPASKAKPSNQATTDETVNGNEISSGTELPSANIRKEDGRKTLTDESCKILPPKKRFKIVDEFENSPDLINKTRHQTKPQNDKSIIENTNSDDFEREIIYGNLFHSPAHELSDDNVSNIEELKIQSAETNEDIINNEFEGKKFKLEIEEKKSKLSKSQKLENDKNALIEKLSKQQAERTQFILNQQAEREEKTMKSLDTMLQQNSLLLVQAFAMAQNASTVVQPISLPAQPYFFPNSPLNFNPSTWNPLQNAENTFNMPYMHNLYPFQLQNPAQPFIVNNVPAAQINQFDLLPKENNEQPDTPNEDLVDRTTDGTEELKET